MTFKQTKDVAEVLAKLPEHCFLQDPIEPTHVHLLKRGSVGYWLFRVKQTPEEAKAFCASHNEGVTPAQLAAMEAGSHFGWDIPGANPDNYDANGRPQCDRAQAA